MYRRNQEHTKHRNPIWGIVCKSTFLAASLSLALATSSYAEDSSFLVDTEGELARVVSGAYGELFPNGRDAHAEAQVLALERVGKDRHERLLVPDTESFWPESSAQIISDERANVTYLLWESRVNGVHPLLKLVAFDGQDWGEVREITAGVFASKGEPQLRVTHDTHDSQQGAGPVERTVLHVSWWEEIAGSKEKRYAFLALENGVFVDSYEVVDLIPLPSFSGGNTEHSAFESMIRMQSGSHKDMVVMGFHDPSIDRLVGLQIEVLPQALSRLSDHLKSELAAADVSNIEAVRAAVERALKLVENDFHSVGLDLIRNDLFSFLAELQAADPDPDIPLLHKMGARVIWIGAKVGRGGLAIPGEQELIEIVNPFGEQRSHHVALTPVTSWSVPSVGADPSLFLSQDGSEALIAWLGSDLMTVEYLETQNGEWTDAQTLSLPAGVGTDQAMRWLEQKALER